MTGIPGAGKDSLGSEAGPLPPGLTPIVAQSRSGGGKHLVIVGADQTADAAEIIHRVVGAVGGSLQGLRQDHLLVEHMNVPLGPVGGVAAVTGAAGRDDHSQVIRPCQVCAAPAGEIIALPGGIHQGDGGGLHAVPGGIAVGRAAVQVIGDGVRDQLPGGGKGSAGHRIALDQAAVGIVVGHRPAAVHPVQEGIAGPGGVGHACQNIVVPAQASALRRAAVARVIVHGKGLGRKHRLHGDGSGGHKKSVVGDGHIAADHLPVVEGVSRCGNGGEGDLGARRRSFGGRRRRAAAFGLYRNVIGHQGCAADQIQLLVVPVLHMGVGVVRGEAVRAVRRPGVGKCRGIALILRGNAHAGAIRQVAGDGQRFAGGQVHVVRLAGNRVTLHGSGVSDLQLAAVAGVDINAAAIAAGFVFLDRTAIELADRAGAVNIHTAAVAGGRIAGDGTACHVQHRRLLIQIDGAAVSAAAIIDDLAAGEIDGAVCIQHFNRTALGGFVAADLAAGHVEYRSLIRVGAQADGAAPAVGGIAGDLCAAGNGDGAPAHQNGAAVQTGGIAGDLRAAGNVDRTIAAHIDGAAAGIVAVHGRCIAGDGAAGHVDGAAGGGEEGAAVFSRVILDGAAVHVESAAGDVGLVGLEFSENGTAVVLAVVAGDLAAVHVEYALLVIQSDGSAAAAAGNLAAGELAAEQVQRAGIQIHAAAAPDVLRRALDGASAGAVAENKSAAVFDLNLGCAVAGKGLAVQAQI